MADASSLSADTPRSHGMSSKADAYYPQYVSPVTNNFISCLNKCGPIYYFTLSILIYVAVLHYTDYTFNSFDSWNMKVFVTYAMINMMGNYYLCTTYTAAYDAVKDLDTSLPTETWHYCSYCKHLQPPRCHHCPLCQQCINKRDHHCFFMSVCIGKENQRYFMAYCLHVILGMYCGSYTIALHLSNTYYDVFTSDCYYYFPPVTIFNLLRGRVEFYTFLLSMLLCCCLCIAIFTILLLFWQLFLVLFDFTSYEAAEAWEQKRIPWTTTRYWSNITATLGPVPPLVFLIPLIRFPRGCHNPISFKTCMY